MMCWKLGMAGLLIVGITGCKPQQDQKQEPVMDRKQFNEVLQQQEVKRVTEAELTQAAIDRGDQLVKDLQMALEQDSAFGNMPVDQQILQGISKQEQELSPVIQFLVAADTSRASLHPKQRQLLQAYAYDPEFAETTSANIQRIGTDSLLYTRVQLFPSSESAADSSKQLGVWNILFSRKEIILKL